MADFRFSQLPGSSNSSLLISRQNIELTYDATCDLADFVSRSEETLVTMDLAASPGGNVAFTDSGAAVNSTGDKLTVLVFGSGTEVVSFGTGFVAGAGDTIITQGVFSFISNGTTWMLSATSVL